MMPATRMLSVKINAPAVAKLISNHARPAAPKYPPGPMSGPGETAGPTSASSVQTATSVISQPLARSTKSDMGLRTSSHKSKPNSEITKKYAPQPSNLNRLSEAYAPER